MRCFVLGLFLVFLASLGGLSAAGATVAAWAENYENPTLGPASSVSDLAFSVGHMRIDLASGEAAPVRVGGETVGLFFRGHGGFVYESGDPLESVVGRFNTEKATGLKARESAGGFTIESPLQEILLWSSPDRLVELAGGAAAPVESAFRKHRDWFADDWRSPPSLLFLRPRVDWPAATVVRAEMSTGRDKLVYLYDPVQARSESLYCLLERKVLHDVRSGVTLSDQPIGYDRRDFQNPAFLLTDVEYTLTAAGEQAQLAVTETLVPVGTDQRVFRFDLWNEILANGGRRHLRLKSVKDGAGRTLSYFHKYGELVVGLPAAAPADQPFKIHFEIEGDFIVRPAGDNYWRLGLGSWFPQPEYRGRFFTVRSTLRAKKPFVPLAPGKTLSRHQEGDYNVVVNRIDKPVFGTVALAGKYAYDEETQDGLTVRVATYGGRNARAIKQLTNLVFKIIEFYEPFLGPFPFEEYNIIEIRSWGFGQGPPATMYITQEAFNPRFGVLPQIYSQGINHRFAHEVAHQYWGNVVKAAGGEDTWVHESFAEYSSAFVVKRLKGKSGFNSLLATWKSDAKQASKIAPIPLANRIMDPANRNQSSRWRNQLVYSKGAHLLASLHRELGDDLFFSYLRSVQSVYAWKMVTTRNLVDLLEHMTQRDYGPFFDQYFWGTGVPQ